MTKTYWFAAKRYGWGWGLPLTWQGWVVYISYLLVVVFNWFLFHPHVQHQNLLYFFTIFFLATGMLIIICYKKGEKPHWRWGKKK